MSSFDTIFKAVAKSTAKDPLASVHKAGDITIKSHIPWGVLTGIPELDLNMGRPGWPAGRCVELYGFEHSGKTTMAYHAIAQAQKAGGGAWFIDTEKSFDEDRAAQCGVNVDVNFGIGDADSIDAAFRLVQNILAARKDDYDGKPFVIVIDSITGVATEVMLKKTIGEEERVGQDARTIRGGMRRIGPDVAETNTNLFMVNHETSLVALTKWAKQSDSSGGHAIKLAATVRCAMKHSGWLKDEEDKDRRLGQKIKIRVEKLKGSRLDYPEVKETLLLNTVGFDTQTSLLKAGCTSGWIDHKSGSKDYKFGDVSFPSRDWNQIVFDMGGIDKAYTTFITWCMKEGRINPWGQPIR